MRKPIDQIIRDTTSDYLNVLKTKSPLPSIDDIAIGLLHATTLAFEAENINRPKNAKLRMPDKLTPSQIADIILALFPVYVISMTENGSRNGAIPAVYQTDGFNRGIYDTDENSLERFIQKFCHTISRREMEEVVTYIRRSAELRVRESDPDLVAVNNGIFNYKTKQLLPFSPDHVFISKSHVDYNPAAANVNIHNNTDNTNWDVESWMQSLSDDPDIVSLLWEIIGAVVRPNVRWNKSAWLYSESGNNGKGTLCELMRSLCGQGAYASIPISDFGKDFMLEPLISVNAVIVDENDVGGYIDRAANLKAVITNDVIQINRKFKTPVAFQFHGFMVQCLNEFPKIRDRSDSVYRRQLFVPMNKCFTGHERKYIKEDYLHRRDVLEYVLKRILESNYYTLSCPQACNAVINEYKEFNDPIRQFYNEFHDRFTWDFVPFEYLYDLYRVWFEKNHPSGTKVSKNVFRKELVNALPPGAEWAPTERDPNGGYKKIRPRNMMDNPEPISKEYDLTEWMQRDARSSRLDSSWVPILKDNYRGGLIRTNLAMTYIDEDEENDA